MAPKKAAKGKARAAPKRPARAKARPVEVDEENDEEVKFAAEEKRKMQRNALGQLTNARFVLISTSFVL